MPAKVNKKKQSKIKKSSSKKLNLDRSFKSRTSFSKLIIENFKGYNRNTQIELCEGVNLIYGKNSAGKSSIIQSLRLIRQNLLVTNTSVPFVPVAPLNLGLHGKIQFSEGIEGIILKDKKRELKLGVELKTTFDDKKILIEDP